jgi:tetratricopeptide (TPR) repeat protein
MKAALVRHNALLRQAIGDHRGHVFQILGNDVDEAVRLCAQYLPLVRETENGIVRNFILESAAEADLRAGRMNEAAAMVAQAIDVAEIAGAPHYLALDLRVQGQVFAAQGRIEDALASFDRAVALFEQTVSRLEGNRALHHRARLLLGHGGDTQRAAAREAFAAMGAVHDRERAERLPG